MEIEHYERIVLNFRPQVLERIEDEETSFASVLTPPFPQKFNHFSLSDKQVDEMINILGRLEKSLCKNMFGHTVLSRACLAEFLVTLANYNSNNTVAESQNAMMPVVKKIFDFIDKNLYNELTVEIIARELHHNSDYLGRVFKNYVGDSLKYYINAKKVALAQQLLMEGVPPYDVCFTLCFNNYSSFSRCFSKHTGLSPKQYVMSLKTPSSI